MSDLTIIFISVTCLGILAIMIYGYKSRTKSKPTANSQNLDRQSPAAEQRQTRKPLDAKSDDVDVNVKAQTRAGATAKHAQRQADAPPPPQKPPPVTARLTIPATMTDDVSAAGGHPDPSLLDATIMLIDDEPTTLDVLQALLEDAGYRHFITTSQSEQAIELIGNENPDVVLTDLNMPEVTGFDILKPMRAHIRLQHIPVIVLTSDDSAKTKLQALHLGATDFLAKPVDPSELALRLRNTLAAKAHQDRLANYDPLTGLPNRRLFMSRLDRALQQAKRGAKIGAVLHINLGRFKQINETLGHSAGDALLKMVAQRLEHALYTRMGQRDRGDAKTLLSRIGGDEFIVLLPEAHSSMDADQLVRHLLDALGESFHMDNHDLVVTACIGIAMFPTDGDNIETLLKHVDVATNHTKQKGSNTYAFYSNDMNAKALERLSLESQLRKALERDELLLYYQPQIEVKTGRIMSAEAFLHWQHPELGLLPPEQFMPLAEDIGLIVALGEWALQTACEHIKTWQATSFALNLSMNVSNQQLHDRNFKRTIYRALAKNRLAPQHLTLEFTESMLMQNASEHVDALQQMKSMGVRLAIDHFGKGYSSLIYLEQFPLDELKIDDAFLKALKTGADDAPIITAIIAMAHSLGFTTVVKGVETDRQLTFLRDRECDAYQGRRFSPPVPVEEFTSLLSNSTPPVPQPTVGG